MVSGNSYRSWRSVTIELLVSLVGNSIYVVCIHIDPGMLKCSCIHIDPGMLKCNNRVIGKLGRQ